ncbi:MULTISPECIES: class I SAM-dependent methyltransferase [Polymorphospora]|uniref:Class I SAM-dependent methyltransferase n=1 Tax=Polymorphospora lycopeni TaxID=3140240 RepID=A0ABV5CWB2_9ACTN
MLDEINIRHQVAYDEIAERFAEINAEMPAGYLVPAQEFGKLAEAGPILDLGCGAGRDMAYWADRGRRVVGLDLSLGMLRQAAARCGQPLAQGDMCGLPFRAGVFTGVWCSASLLHLPKALAPVVLAEVARVLRPGGVLMVALKEGGGEGWEDESFWNAPGGVTRFFARYASTEVDALLAADFDTRVQRRYTSEIGTAWLTHLAVRRP